MKRTLTASLAFWGLAALLVASCQSEAEVAPSEAVPGSVLPANFPAPAYALDQNPPSREAFELGRMLFYEPMLSRDGSVSCGSCHQQFVAFANADHRVSHGVAGRLGTRNAPALQNLRWKRDFFWDGGPKNLETLPLAPLTNPLEMDETLENALHKLNASSEYQQRFFKLYGRQPIDSYQFLRTLAQFTAGLTSANSRYDQYVRHEPGGDLTAAELRGRAVLAQKCAACHSTDLFTDDSFHNNGLDRQFATDSGRAHVTAVRADVGLFKVPSLRNVALTAPYMHDGRFQTLAQVLEHYDHGVAESPTLDPILRRPDGQLGIPLTSQEKSDLVAFFNTLTDQEFLKDKRLSGRP
ncbi:cytochrome-c peroxidase [Hymenobacter sp. BT491]|uniref:cytochrome-c peroxidase n=1 Tax=Hymenobacter sp. BT491 TaxID=2766779 RepID=UPI001653E5DE|nr:cytochrome c peroxidase [Hymenobacter sp. BT491]MBC6988621.1 cytochrome-c peroxidase [Hymenobacter sp. BT491]